jgi:hypothetical protein
MAEHEDVARSFACVAPYEGFVLPEVQEVLSAPSPESVMIHDCWTPCEVRDKDSLGSTIRQLAARLSTEGKDVWTFSTDDSATIAAIEGAGFKMQTSLVKRRLLFRDRTSQQSEGTSEPKQAESLPKEAVR